jgi:hypothetical protein
MILPGSQFAITRYGLGWRAAQRSGQRWDHIRTHHDLARRFFRRHFFAGRRWRAAGRIQQPAVLDDLFDLRTIKRFIFE